MKCESTSCTNEAVYQCTAKEFSGQKAYVRDYCAECTAALVKGISAIVAQPENHGHKLHEFLEVEHVNAKALQTN
jgi:hypothetical protein